MLTSTRRGILYPNTTRVDSADVPRDFAAMVAALEIDVIYGQGTLAARPAFGVQGRMYEATDQTPKAFYWDNGTGWDPIGAISAGSIGTTQLADGSVTTIKIADANVTLAKLAANSVDSSKVVDGSLVAADHAAALFPSQGAGAATEAFRALGTAAGTAAAGTHGSQHGSAAADPIAASSLNPSVIIGTAVVTADSRLSDQRVPTANSVDSSKIVDYSIASTDLGPITINGQAASYTLVLADQNKIIEVSNAGPVTLTIPPNSSVAFPIGTTITVTQIGTGQITVTPGAGVTLRSNPGAKTAGQYAMATIYKRGTDEWVVSGNVVP